MSIIKYENYDLTDLVKAFDEIQMSRSPYALEQLVVNSKFTEEYKYNQCVLELSVAYDNLRTVKCESELKEIEISEIDDSTRKGELEKEIKIVELERLNRAMREFKTLYELWTKFPKKYTRQDLDDASPLEYKMKLDTQAQQDIASMGRISTSNQEGLRQVNSKQLSLMFEENKLLK